MCILHAQSFLGSAVQCKISRQQGPARRPVQIRAQEVAVNLSTGKKNKVPIELEKGDLPLNTFNNKKPFKGKIVSVERIVGPKATGETCHIVVETNGDIPYWEGQSYGVIPPVILPSRPASCLQVLWLVFRLRDIRISVLCCMCCAPLLALKSCATVRAEALGH